MMKILYQHQVKPIQQGFSIESTMPVSTTEACVISFDIIGSTKIRHIKVK
jgi:hypothetical protein